jgi:hypothetical protein
MEEVPDAKEFVEARFCISNYQRSKLHLGDNTSGYLQGEGLVFLIYTDDSQTYEFIYNKERKEFGEWKGHRESCCSMSCDYYGCALNYK